MTTKPTFTISELAQEFGVTTRTIRFYEAKGLLNPARDGRTRRFSSGDRVRLSLILRGKRVGFSLDEIGELLNLYKLDDGNATQLRVALDRFQKRIEVLQQQREDIDAAIAELEVGCVQVREMLNAHQDEQPHTPTVAPSAAGYGGPLSTARPESST